MGAETRMLREEVARIRRVLQDLEARLQGFREVDMQQLGRSQVAAVFVAQVLDNWYTALETAFVRVSQSFENDLRTDRWHADLLDKMTIHVAGIRERVISEDARPMLRELMSFRHFKRYYFQLDYDWRKLDFLLDVFDRVRPMVARDLDAFGAFLERLGEA